MAYLIYLVIICGYVFSRGFFTIPEALVMFAGAAIFFAWLAFPKKFKVRVNLGPEPLLVILTLLCLIMYGGLYQKSPGLVLLSLGLLTVNFCLSFFVSHRAVFSAMFLLAIILRVFMIFSSPNPRIDVYDYLRRGALALSLGQNPYSITYQKMYADVKPDSYNYFPGMIYLTWPAVAVFDDPRYTFVLAEMGTAVLIYLMTKKKILTLLFLSNPISLYMIEQSYTEPLILFGLTLFAYLWCHKREWLAAAVLGFLLGTKQYVIFLLPLALRKFNLIIISLLVAAVLIGPFWLWNPADFIHDAVTLQINFLPRYEGLTFFSLLHRFGLDYNFVLMLVLVLPGTAFVYLRRKVALPQFFLLASFFLLVFFFFNKWAFINYYYLISQLFLVGTVLNEENISAGRNY